MSITHNPQKSKQKKQKQKQNSMTRAQPQTLTSIAYVIAITFKATNWQINKNKTNG